jgi:hypothetical protein
MDNFTVYLFVRDNSRSQPPVAIRRRLHALNSLREELAALGNVRVTAVPHEADLQVEIKNVFSGDENRAGTKPHGAAADRVLIIRMMIADEPVEFVCADGIGNVPAEHHAAKRVLVWLYSLMACHPRAGGSLLAGMSFN